MRKPFPSRFTFYVSHPGLPIPARLTWPLRSSQRRSPMAEQMQPSSKQAAPDPSNAYERSHPDREAGMGRMDNNVATPRSAPDQARQAVKNEQDPTRQVNAQDDAAPQRNQGNQAEQPDHSMKDEEPMGWDQAPTDIQDPEQKRHPRTGGQGGVR